MSVTNRERAEWAHTAVEAFSVSAGYRGEPMETKIADLLADLWHLCVLEGIDRSRVLDTASLHFHAEREEES